MKNAHILIIDDEPDIRNLISDILKDEGYSVATAGNGNEANQQLSRTKPQLILLDIWMPDIDGISLLKSWNENHLVTAPIVMMSGHGTVETAVEATRLGAKDFIEKPLSLAKLLQTVTDTLEQYSTQVEEQSMETRVGLVSPIGNSPAINALKSALEKIYKTKNHVMIEGESGTGKYSTAQLIHQNRHPNEPCILLDAQMLGADFEQKLLSSSGSFMRAGSGTLIINNVDCLSIGQQTVILSCLKHKQFMLYGQNTIQAINFQIISLSKKELNLHVNQSPFLTELYELLAEVKLLLPSLQQRQEDIPELLNYYVNTLPDTEQTPYRKMSFAAQNRLRNHNWTHNIQELKNTVRQLQLLGGEGEITLEEVNGLLSEQQESKDNPVNNWYDLPLREAREAFEKDYLIHQLKSVEGRVGELAKLAGMERTHLYRKLRTLNINPKDVMNS